MLYNGPFIQVWNERQLFVVQSVTKKKEWTKRYKKIVLNAVHVLEISFEFVQEFYPRKMKFRVQ